MQFQNKVGALGKTQGEGVCEARLMAEAPVCPQRGSERLYKDGLRYTAQGPIQRWRCQNCFDRMRHMFTGAEWRKMGEEGFSNSEKEGGIPLSVSVPI